MVAPASFAWTLRDVAVAAADRVYLVAGHDKSTKQDIPVSSFMRWTGKWSSKSFPLNLTSVCVVFEPERNSLMMGVDGTVVRGTAKGFDEEQVDAGHEAPRNVGDLREIRRIGKRAYVIGMRRMAYRCDGPARWTRIDQGVRCGVDDTADAGFNSIHGFGEAEIYAAGWDGEIWKYDGKRWTAVDSPTNLALFRVVCGGDGKAYACGQRGTVIAGRDTQWTVIHQDATKDDFYGATWFKNKLYLATAKGLFSLVGDTIEPIEIKSEKKLKITAKCFNRLDASEDAMWSVGLKMAMWTEDGVNWTELPYS
ncbi:MAG TPA: hypothetical protein VN681_12685 [Stellaceae bacterium]|nr:hypothetical protein [Stellaceae bacterium]